MCEDESPVMRSTVVILAAVVVFSAAPVRADAPPPWSVGVTDAQKAKAKKFLDEGNTLLLEKKYALALEKYNAAVSSWNHPAIRFNIVRCLIQLGQPVEAYDNLQLALKFGAAPLEDQVYSEALAYQTLLANQIAELSVHCEQPGVKVTLDGQPLPSCPSNEARRVKPGTHQLVGARPGLLTQVSDIEIVGGTQKRVTIHLDSLAASARIEHRWSAWIPWVVIGGGVALAGIGGVVELSAASDRASFDRVVQVNCRTSKCTDADLEAAHVLGLDKTARTKSAIGISVLAIGGAAVVTGVALLYLNRGRTVYRESRRLTPTVNALPGGAAVSVGGVF
jgi:hypothetical protein